MTLGNRQRMQDVYLGDGVYASFDGFQIWLAVNHHENKVVAIEPKVMETLLGYAQVVWPKPVTVEHVPSDDTEGGGL
jgi:hypothetical protein